MRGRIKGYTLIELLIVVMIMALLMGIALPAFTKIAKGTGVKLAATNIAGKISATRSWAVSQRRYAAIIFPTTETGGLLDIYRYAKYRACQVYYDSANSRWNFSSWIDGENWDDLPPGTLVYDISGSNTVKDLYYSAASTTIDNVSGLKSNGSSLAVSKAIIFKPSGSMVADDYTSATITLKEGAYTGGAIQVTSSSNVMTLSVNPFTCKVTYDY